MIELGKEYKITIPENQFYIEQGLNPPMEHGTAYKLKIYNLNVITKEKIVCQFTGRISYLCKTLEKDRKDVKTIFNFLFDPDLLVYCYDFELNPIDDNKCICGAAKAGYTKASRHHSAFMKCPMFKE